MKIFCLVIISVGLCIPLYGHAAERELRVGVIASLTGFAAQYGQAVVDGVQVAVAELAKQNVKVRLFLEDDRSEVRGAASAYQKLRSIDKIEALVGGSWWVNGIVKIVERDSIPFISCETLYNKDFVQGTNYFSLAGDLRDWIRAFAPLVNQHGWRSVVMVRFVSGFADTLESELKILFGPPHRTFLQSIEYSDLEMTGASTLAVRAIAQHAQVIFVDAQPQTFAIFVKELEKLKARDIIVLTHSVAEDAARQRLINPGDFEGRMFFLRRSSYDNQLVKKFQEFNGSVPQLNGDLGYYALQLIAQANEQSGDPVAALKAGVLVDGVKFSFDENNVSHTVVQEVFGFRDGQVVKF